MRQRALIDINLLLDTRLAVLARLDPSAANTIGRSEWYRNRDTDNFEAVSEGVIKNDDFKAMYNKFEIETLVNGLMTDFIYILRKEVEEIIPTMEIKGIDHVITFDVNVYPYELLPEEKEVIRRSIARYVSTPAKINVVSTAYHLLTPKLLDNNYDMMALYNYEDWLKYHQDELHANPMIEFTIFHPRIAPSGEVPESDDIFKDPFMVIPMALCRHIQLHPIPTSYTCWQPKLYDGVNRQK